MGNSPRGTSWGEKELKSKKKPNLYVLSETTQFQKKCDSNALKYHMDSNNEERVFRKTMGSHDPTSNAHRQIMSPRQLMVYHFCGALFSTYCHVLHLLREPHQQYLQQNQNEQHKRRGCWLLCGCCQNVCASWTDCGNIWSFSPETRQRPRWSIAIFNNLDDFPHEPNVPRLFLAQPTDTFFWWFLHL